MVADLVVEQLHFGGLYKEAPVTRQEVEKYGYEMP